MPPRPIFIVGSGRSGTSALTWAIGQHPNIIATPETNWLSMLACYLGPFHAVGGAVPGAHIGIFGVSRAAFLRQFGTAADELVRSSFETKFPNRRAARAPDPKPLMWFRSPDDPKERWVDGTPSSTPYAIVLAEMFPEARFINLVRRPDDVLLSWLGFSSRAPDQAAAQSVVDRIYRFQRIGYLIDAAVPERTIRVLQEDIIASPATVLREIASFVGEEYSPDMAGAYDVGPVNSSGEGKEQARQESIMVADHPKMREMREWYQAASSDSTWKITNRDEAGDLLSHEAKVRLPLPG